MRAAGDPGAREILDLLHRHQSALASSQRQLFTALGKGGNAASARAVVTRIANTLQQVRTEVASVRPASSAGIKGQHELLLGLRQTYIAYTYLDKALATAAPKTITQFSGFAKALGYRGLETSKAAIQELEHAEKKA
jgi:hypothetical protein